MIRTGPSLVKSISVLFFAFLVISGLYFAREFLIPVAISALLAMLFVPLCRWLEAKGIGRSMASILCILSLLGGLSIIFLLLSWQAGGIVEDLSQISKRLEEILNQIREYIAKNAGISLDKQKELIESQTAGASGGTSGAGTVVSAIMGIGVNSILALVYLFLFLASRSHLKKFVLMLVPDTEVNETKKIIEDSGIVAQRYVSGLSTMIVCLWIMYGIGFSIVGVENALFFAILCGLLEIIPFVGNLIGNALTVMMVISQGGSGSMIIGVLVTYMLVQFIQTYILEPLVVGSEVNINPLFTIMILVLMEIIWGIAGLILAIPMLGIIKIVCDHVSPLKPYGFLIGVEKSGGDSPIITKIKSLFGSSKEKTGTSGQPGSKKAKTKN